MRKSKRLASFVISTETVRTKRSAFLGKDNSLTTYVVWSPDNLKDVREYATFREAARVAHGFNEKHADRNYRVFKSCWGWPSDLAKLKEVPESVKATTVETT